MSDGEEAATKPNRLRRRVPLRRIYPGTGDWTVHPWKTCTGCDTPCRVSHSRLGKCVTCSLPALREERQAATTRTDGGW